MKTISVVIPTYNEEENIPLIYQRVKELFRDQLKLYRYEIVYIDNRSTDSSRQVIETLCKQDENVTGIFNARNFGFNRSTYYGLIQGIGDCTVLIFADMQDPPEVIVDFVHAWEQGYKIVIGKKRKSKESKLMYMFRTFYYKLIKSITDIDHIEQFTGFGLYDRDFIKVLQKLDDSLPYLRGIVAELGYDRYEVQYDQDIRKYGKTSFNFLKLYDVAMLGITSYSKVILRLATISGFVMSGISFLIGCITFIVKLMYWDKFQMGLAGMSVGLFFIGSVLLFFIGFQGEYILNINTRVMKRPLVIEERRLNPKVQNEEEDYGKQ